MLVTLQAHLARGTVADTNLRWSGAGGTGDRLGSRWLPTRFAIFTKRAARRQARIGNGIATRFYKHIILLRAKRPAFFKGLTFRLLALPRFVR